MTTRKAVVNRLVGSGANLDSIGAAGKWSISALSGQYGSVEFFDSEFSSDPDKKQIKISGVPATPSGISISFDELVLETFDHEKFMELVFYARIDGGGTIEVNITDTVVAGTSEQETTFNVPGVVNVPEANGLANPSWKAYRADPLKVVKGNLSSPRLTAQINFKPNIAGTAVYFAGPAIYGYADHFRYSQSATQMSVSMPDHVMDEDYSETNPTESLTRFIDVCFTGLDRAIKTLLAYRFRTKLEFRNENDPETLSRLVWPSNTEINEAKWLTQFTGTEPVAKLSSTLDPSNPFILNVSVLNGTDTLRFSTTGVNDPPLGTVEVTRDFLRWQAEYGYYGMNAGSVAAVRESVKRVMVEPRDVTIDLQHDGPFTVLVRTPWEQTYGASEDDVGEASPVVLEAIERARPIGVKITHELT